MAARGLEEEQVACQLPLGLPIHVCGFNVCVCGDPALGSGPREEKRSHSPQDTLPR